MKKKLHFIILIAVLILLGTGVTVYKVWGLGFSLSPDQRVSVWTVEAEITFAAHGEPVEVSLNLPDNRQGLVAVDSVIKQGDYDYQVKKVGTHTRGIWSIDKAFGPQKIYFQSQIYRKDPQHARPVEENYKPDPFPPFRPAQKELATEIVRQAKSKGDKPLDIAINVLQMLNVPEANPGVQLLLNDKDEFGGPLGLARTILHEAGVTSRRVKGFFLDENTSGRTITGYLEIKTGDEWVLVDPVRAVILDSGSFLLWQTGNESVLEVTGGSDSAVKFSSLTTSIIANKAAISAGLGESKSMLVDFSIYSLPLQFQNSFKLLLLIPFGALVVVVMRNLVGIRTSGTFLPILIAMTFIQTSLISGLILFVMVVSLGLVLRSYLSRLNLLLVPRISAVLVFVIVIYLALAVISYKLGSEFGLLVSFFPMIIIAWTIERMSILWEEEGPKEVLIQGGGSLLTASLVYLLITNSYVEHISYAFPELLLVVLAIILCIGSYTGYRLSELRRFEPLGRM
ncbi:UUP1 family membrane protein [Oleidesulfovibrio sp.]|uniref:UUP1 family membrane protein n=1 Tax=Oleidesulfovibrio sp. TaxID=2909707 RepID=UPI003A8C0608